MPEEGFHVQSDVLYTLADGTPINELFMEFSETLTQYNASRDTLFDLLTYPVNKVYDRVVTPGGTHYLEPESEFGQPRGLRAATVPRYVGFDFTWYDSALRYTWRFLKEADRSQVEADHNEELEADRRTLFRKLLQTVLTKENGGTVQAKSNVGFAPITVYRFFNNDGWVPDSYKQNTFVGTHQHYLTTGAALVGPEDLEAMEDHLRHHGHELATFILIVPRTESITIQSFKKGTASARYDFIPAQGLLPWFFPQGGVLVGQVPATPPQAVARHGGFVGTYGKWYVLEEDWMPAGYMFGFASGGERALANPIAWREHENAALRGFMLIEGPRADYPLIDSFYNRGFGSGVRVRSAGVAMQTTVSATYTTPVIT